MTNTRTFPRTIHNTPDNAEVLARVFNYAASSYDLSAYDRAMPGLGYSIWVLIETERANLEADAAWEEQRRKAFWDGFMSVFSFGFLGGRSAFEGYLKTSDEFSAEERIGRYMHCAVARAALSSPEIRAAVLREQAPGAPAP